VILFTREFWSPFCINAIVMSQRANGQTGKVKHSAPNPERNVSFQKTGVFILSTVSAEVSETGALDIADTVCDELTVEIICEINEIYSAWQDFMKQNRKHGEVMLAVGKRYGYVPFGFKRTTKGHTINFPPHLSRGAGCSDMKDTEISGFEDTYKCAAEYFELKRVEIPAISKLINEQAFYSCRIHFYVDESLPGMGLHLDNQANLFSGLKHKWSISGPIWDDASLKDFTPDFFSKYLEQYRFLRNKYHTLRGTVHE